MSKFPLFESLFQDTTHEHELPFPPERQTFIINHIADLDETGREVFYALIREDHLRRTNDPNILPPCCKQMKSGIRVEFDKVPLHMKYVLHSFIERHLRKLQEDAMFFQPRSSIDSSTPPSSATLKNTTATTVDHRVS